MKKLCIALLCAAFILTSQAQPRKIAEIPAKVKANFAASFPQAQKVKWSVEKTGEFEAEFVLNSVETSALYDKNGTLLITESEISLTELPKVIKDFLTKEYAGYKLDAIEKAVDGKKTITYEMEAKKDHLTYELRFDSDGKVIQKKEKKPERH